MSAIEKATPSLLAEIDFADLLEWLNRQPDSRRFNYFGNTPAKSSECVICAYLKHKGQSDFKVGGKDYGLNGKTCLPIPQVLAEKLSWLPTTFTAAQAKEALTGVDISALRAKEVA